ncbi:hypothetical protein ACN3XK_72325 [Actinomadura welshii]
MGGCGLEARHRDQQLQRWNGRLTASPPKAAQSARVIALDRTTIGAPRAHRDRQ